MMGWASGSYLAQDVWNLVRPHIPQEKRKQLAAKIYDMFCDEDADDWDLSSPLCVDAEVKCEEG